MSRSDGTGYGPDFPERLQYGVPAGTKIRLRKLARSDGTSAGELFRRIVRNGIENTERAARARAQREREAHTKEHAAQRVDRATASGAETARDVARMNAPDHTQGAAQ